MFFEKEIEANTFLQQYFTEYNKVYSRATGKFGEEIGGKDLTGEHSRPCLPPPVSPAGLCGGQISGEECSQE
ncbi:hypothetical protein [Desulforamulus ruminis]|uniref:hypothetical protein n=1 Tax=Desulforamulus ruminis TaxID=1564 RepID=UPI00030C0F27|nr:hypothetical protein [Desulforamulus ruminis]